MKNKITKRNKARWKKRFKMASGFPMHLWMYDYYSEQAIREEAGYRSMDKEARTKKSKENGFYEMIFGKTPKHYKGKQRGV